MKKIQFEDYLHSIDKQFESKEKKEIYMIYIMIFSAIFAFSYMLFWDNARNTFQNKLSTIQDLKLKIKMDKIYLKTNTPATIAALDSQIKKTKIALITHKDYNQYIKTKIESIPFLLYDEKVWGNYLNSIDSKAKKYQIKILKLNNNYNFTGESFGHVLDVAIQSNGHYKNTLKFLNSLEESELVVDVHDFDINATNFLESDINLSVWGIRY